jgi:nicotinic acetylcholine receptor
MQRPGRNVTFRSLLRTAKMQDLEMGERSSRSLLANVLDLDDDFRRITHTIHVNHIDGGDAFEGKARGGATRNGDARPPPINRGQSMGTPPANRNWAVHGGRPGMAVWSDVGGGDSSIAGLSEMRDIVRELRTITSRLKKEESTQEVLNDWRFAAQVVDRLCLYLFVILTAITTAAILLQAPHFA